MRILQEVTQGCERTKSNISLLLYITFFFVEMKEYDLAFKNYELIKAILPKQKINQVIR
jgi:hypothetical protein